jgi:hypothetical protein
MHHTVAFVAHARGLDLERFRQFAQTHQGAYRDARGELWTNTWHVDELVADFRRAESQNLDSRMLAR